jgi:hypothetical protein
MDFFPQKLPEIFARRATEGNLRKDVLENLFQPWRRRGSEEIVSLNPAWM